MRVFPAAVLAAALAVAGCRPEAPAPTPLPAAVAGAASELSPGIVTLAAEIAATGGAGVTGAVVLTEADGRLIVAAALDGLAPGTYALHVREAAQCGPAAGEPAGKAIGTFESDARGQARFSVERAEPAGAAAFVGRAVAVHARSAAGTRGVLVGCGVLRPIAR